MSAEVYYARFVRPALFLLPAELAHRGAVAALRVLQRFGWLRRGIGAVIQRPSGGAGPTVEALGRTFASPVGLAAGFDKDAEVYNALGALGFASVEVGTITAEAQPGNPRPRVFRLTADRAVVNRMGFNNRGARAAAEAVERHPPDRAVVLGVNIGKTKATPLEHAAEDYAASARRLGPHAGYLVLNVSSPNTPGLRTLQSVAALRGVIAAVQRELVGVAPRPALLVKIAPDLADEDVDAVVDLALEMGLAGVVATNTTVRREGLRAAPHVVARAGTGGLSGPPLRPRARAVVARVYARAAGRLVVVGVGGVETADDAWELVRAGATLVQVYTGLVYRGPGLAAELRRGLAERFAASGYSRWEDAVGSAVRAGADGEAPRGA